MVASGARGGAVAPPRARERARGGGTHTRTHTHTHTHTLAGTTARARSATQARTHTGVRLCQQGPRPTPTTANRTPFLTDGAHRRGGASLCTGDDTGGGDAARSPRTAMAAKGTRRRDPFVRCGCVCVHVCVCVWYSHSLERGGERAPLGRAIARPKESRARAGAAPAPRAAAWRGSASAPAQLRRAFIPPPSPASARPGWPAPAHTPHCAPPVRPRRRGRAGRPYAQRTCTPPTPTHTHTQHPHTHKQEDRARCDDDDTEGAPRRPRTASRPWRRWSRAARRRAARR